MKVSLTAFAAIVLATTLTACGSSSDSKTTPTATTTWSNSAMQSIVLSKCATSGCHNGTQSPNYATISEAGMKADTTAKSQVSSGAMPKTGSLTSAEKTTFLNFYN